MVSASGPTSSSSTSPAARSFSTVSACRGLSPWRRCGVNVAVSTASDISASLCDGVLDEAVEPRPDRPAGVVADHDHDLAELVLVELTGLVRRRDLDGEDVLRAVGGEH